MVLSSIGGLTIEVVVIEVAAISEEGTPGIVETFWIDAFGTEVSGMLDKVLGCTRDRR